MHCLPASDYPHSGPPDHAGRAADVPDDQPATGLPRPSQDVADSLSSSREASPGLPSSGRHGPNAAGVLAVINGVLAGIGGVYLTTHSIWITLLAAISAVFLGGLALITPTNGSRS